MHLQSQRGRAERVLQARPRIGGLIHQLAEESSEDGLVDEGLLLERRGERAQVLDVLLRTLPDVYEFGLAHPVLLGHQWLTAMM